RPPRRCEAIGSHCGTAARMRRRHASRIAAGLQRRPRHDEEPGPMNDSNGYAVFFFPQALEALGEAIKPYLQESPAGAHVLCNAIDTGGALLEMTLHGRDSQDRDIALELMVPTSMVRMIVSTRSDETFGFGPHVAARPEPAVATTGAPETAAVPATPAPEAPPVPPAPAPEAPPVPPAPAPEAPAEAAPAPAAPAEE